MFNWYRHYAASQFYELGMVDKVARVKFENLTQGKNLRSVDVSFDSRSGAITLSVEPTPQLDDWFMQSNTKFLRTMVNTVNPKFGIWKDGKSFDQARLDKMWALRDGITNDTKTIQFSVASFKAILSHSGGGSPYDQSKYVFKFSSPPAFIEWVGNLQQEDFSNELIDELKRMGQYCSEIKARNPQLSNFHHKLPILHERKPVYSKAVKNSRLARYLYECTIKQRLKKVSSQDLENVQTFLSEGDDPNEIDPHSGFMPLDLAADLRVFELLLVYRADPVIRYRGLRNYSTLDRVMIMCDTDKFQLIQTALNFIEKPLPFLVKKIETFQRGNRVVTTLDCCERKNPVQITQRFETELTNTLAHDGDEESAIMKLCQASFTLENDSNQALLKSAVMKDLRRENQVYEIIRTKNGIIGFIIFELVPTQDRNKFIWYCSLSVIENEYRNTGLMPFFLWRTAFSLQFRHTDLAFAIGFLAIHPNSYRLTSKIEHSWPKLQAPHISGEVRDFLKKIGLNTETQYQHHILRCFVTDQIRVSEVKPSKANLLELFFWHTLLEELQMQNTQGKAVPVMFYISDQTFLAFHHHCRQLGIPLTLHCQLFSIYLDQILGNSRGVVALPKPCRQFSPFKDAKQLFWHNQKQESALPEVKSLALFPSKL